MDPVPTFVLHLLGFIMIIWFLLILPFCLYMNFLFFHLWRSHPDYYSKYVIPKFIQESESRLTGLLSPANVYYPFYWKWLKDGPPDNLPDDKACRILKTLYQRYNSIYASIMLVWGLSIFVVALVYAYYMAQQ